MDGQFFRKFESRGIKFARVNSILINKSTTLILYGVEVRCDRERFTVHGPFIEKSMIWHVNLKVFYCIDMNKINTLQKTAMARKHAKKILLQ